MDECKKLQEEYNSDAETDIMVTRERGQGKNKVDVTFTICCVNCTRNMDVLI